ncbi:lipoate--protein ligase family protein [Crocosphaera sp.]|uniref:lipoate--protein ligase family protein n=1 Tax=Crocosphaera sp. TaxID=2729996 RepID=UPI003F25725D|nr:biotin/lipoate A/B protein ligase family protein [Crocosphaera sp.]
MSLKKVWRLIPPIEASGKVQMAIDRWLFEQHENGLILPSLRFYTWSKPTISLGYLQKKYPQHWHSLIWKQEPLDLVIRPTGGRAVLHQDDLTYMIVMSLDNRKTLAIYQDICTFLIQGWKALGISLQYGTAKRGYIHNSSCFNTATMADLITADGSKLIGSAQRRGKQSILQHGSMVLSTDKQLFETIFNQVAPWNLNLREQLSSNYSRGDIIEILTQAAKKHFKIELITQPLSEEEWQEIFKVNQGEFKINV